MTTQKRYINKYYLQCILHIQQEIPHKYDEHTYYGECMRIQEEQTASFLRDFIDDTVIILPQYYDLIQNLLFILRHSGYKEIKKLLPKAEKKFDTMLIAQRKRIAMADSVKPTNLNTPGVNKISILANKKKMLMMSYTDICALGDAINKEREFNTTKIKSKFNSFVSYRIDLVLMGKMPIDTDFPIFLQKYGTERQIRLYKNIISNKTSLRRPTKTQSVPGNTPKTTQKIKKTTQPVKPVVKKEPKQKKSGLGFFKKLGNKISNTAKTVFNAVKKPALVIGIFGAAIFGGKKVVDFVESDNTSPVSTEYVQSYTPKTDTQKALNIVQPSNQTVTQTHQNKTDEKSDTVKNNVLQKSIKRLQNLKATNPTDKNMDVIATANKLYKQFGHDAYNVILTGITAPYALNDHTNFDIRPTTHNMIEYLCNNDLTDTQRAELNKFVANHIAQMNYARQNQR